MRRAGKKGYGMECEEHGAELRKLDSLLRELTYWEDHTKLELTREDRKDIFTLAARHMPETRHWPERQEWGLWPALWVQPDFYCAFMDAHRNALEGMGLTPWEIEARKDRQQEVLQLLRCYEPGEVCVGRGWYGDHWEELSLRSEGRERFPERLLTFGRGLGLLTWRFPALERGAVHIISHDRTGCVYERVPARDTEGRSLYEGDIVQGYGFHPDLIGVIVPYGDGFAVRRKPSAVLNAWPDTLGLPDFPWKVIGNIVETPELLEGWLDSWLDQSC